MNLALVYGVFCSKANGKFDIEGLYRNRGLTGSESFFFNTARGLKELGHDVSLFCDVKEEDPIAASLAGARALSLDSFDADKRRYDAVLSWNEPDYLRAVTPGTVRICVQQLNDFAYARVGFDSFVDLYVSPSQNHKRHMARVGLDRRKIAVVHNSINTEFYEPDEALIRHPHRVVHCSSPDRGLHHLLEMWPAIRERVPDAELRIFYTIRRWLSLFTTCFYVGRSMTKELSARALSIQRSLAELGENGENGVTIVGPCPNTEMARELMQASVLAYTCDPISYTEGFSVSIMDACAAGALPIISDADAIGEVYRGVAEVIPGKPQASRARWIDTIAQALTDEDFRGPRAARAKAFAMKQGRLARAKQWQDLLVPLVRSSEVSAQVCEFRGSQFKVAITQSEPNHPSWYSFIDETVVRERNWRVGEGDVVLDVGAAYGSYSLTALAKGASKVYAWSPQWFDGLCEREMFLRSAALNGWQDKIEVFGQGVYDKAGFLNTVTQDFSNTPPPAPHPDIIEVTTLDDWAGEHLPQLPEGKKAWMKIDVEGAEYHVLEGATDLIRHLRPTILVENHLFKDPTLEDRVRSLLTERFGYREVSTERYHSVSHSLYEPAA